MRSRKISPLLFTRTQTGTKRTARGKAHDAMCLLPTGALVILLREWIPEGRKSAQSIWTSNHKSGESQYCKGKESCKVTRLHSGYKEHSANDSSDDSRGSKISSPLYESENHDDSRPDQRQGITCSLFNHLLIVDSKTERTPENQAKLGKLTWLN